MKTLSKVRASAALAAAVLSIGAIPALAQDASSVIVRDPQSGELRAPTAAELRALQGPQRPTPTAQGAPAVSVVRPDGTRSRKLGERGMTYTRVTRDADGKMVEQCFHGTGAPDALDASAAPATSGKEHGHDQQ
jgi:hypothetical protein